MRSLLALALLVGCGDSSSECRPMSGSRISHRLGFVTSGTQIAGVSWSEKNGNPEPFMHAAIVMTDGTLLPDVPLSPTQVFGIAGKSTVLWSHEHDGLDCEGSKIFDVLLHGASDTKAVRIAGVTSSRTSVFDGTRYQLFWTVDTKIFHRTLDEDGTLGPEHDLGLTDAFCVSAASDRAGTTFVRIGEEGFIVDGATGAKRKVWTSGNFGSHGRTLYFAGEFHIPGFEWWTIEPVSGMSRKRTPPANLGINSFYPGATRLFARGANEMVELSAASLTSVGGFVFPFNTMIQAGTFDDDLLYLVQLPVEDVFGPKQMRVERRGAWTTPEFAIDSPIETLHECP